MIDYKPFKYMHSNDLINIFVGTLIVIDNRLNIWVLPSWYTPDPLDDAYVFRVKSLK